MNVLAKQSQTVRKNTRSLLAQRCALAIVASAMPFVASAELNFVFTYSDAAGVGFNDATQGAARKAALEQTAALLNTYLPGYNGTIRMTVDGAETTDGVLAAAGSNFNASNACDAGFNARGDVGIIALGGADPNSGAADGTVTVNFEDQTWGLGDTISGSDFDFKSTMLHELLHAMGFAHSVNQDGSSACSQAAGSPAGFGPYDRYLGDSNGLIIDQSSFVLDGTRWGSVVTGGAGTAGVQWQGPQGRASNNSAAIPLYTPTTYSNGSSVSHLDDDFYTSQALLMESATGPGQGTRTLSNMEVGILKDLGYANATNTPGSGTGGPPAGTDFTGAWNNASENGWGLVILRGSAAYAVYIYHYGDDSKPDWYLSAAALNGNRFQGTLNAFSGPWFGIVPYNASMVSARNAGTLTIDFTAANTATVNFTIDGRTVNANLTKLSF